ncbi:MAG: tRNA (5-methylaminomethyl-2-thiouridine)(34)-methyltransferase MnmD [Bacteroidales bacterium]|nr:tRNA (5-methylaminomethyl-2-thiouridine)(34)-methyltransferase MnmD [Bacteroidales bacterium]
MDIQLTDDGSQTLYVPSLDEHYHSVKGALTESLHIFIKSGLHHSAKPSPRILEIGFGTGLNALLTVAEAIHDRDIHYTSLERYPLSQAIVSQIDYASLVDKSISPFFQQLHDAPWNTTIDILPTFHLLKVETDFTTYQFTNTYDLIYYDAFAPEKQPEMWTQDIFHRMYAILNPGGILVTYCAKGIVRRMLQSAGFTVERLPGPPAGKREILRATKQ